MNKTKSILFSLALLGSLALNAHAQSGLTNTLASSPATFLNSVSGYFTSFDTNNTQFETARGAVWTGAEYQSGVNIDSVFAIEYQPFTNVALTLGSLTRNAGIAGTIDGEQIDIGWSLVKYDTQITFGVGGGYDFHRDEGIIALYGEVKKALTAHTFAGLRLEEDLNFKGGSPPVPIVGVFAGFSF